MRKFTLASLLLTTILLTNFSFAQTSDSTCCEQSKNQIQFHLVNDYSVSYLKMLTPASGLRFKIDLGLRGSSGDRDVHNENHYLNNQTKQVSTHDGAEENNSSSQYVNLVLNYATYYQLNDELNLFFGAGPLISYSRYNSEATNLYSNVYPDQADSYRNNYKNYNRSFGLGLQLSLGLELNLTKSFSILAEYNLNGTYTWNKETYNFENTSSTNGNKNDYEGTSWSYGLNQLKLGIAYRF